MPYLREPNGDYLRLRRTWTTTGRYRVVRAAALAGVPSSACETAAAPEFLARCVRVRRSDVPAAWLRYLNPPR